MSQFPRPQMQEIGRAADDPKNLEFAPHEVVPLLHYVRRMLQALDGYWLHCDGLPTGRYPRSRATAEDWWDRFEKYRAKVEGRP